MPLQRWFRSRGGVLARAPAVIVRRDSRRTFVRSVQAAARRPRSTWRSRSRPPPVDRGPGRLGRPEPAVASLPVGQRRAVRRWPQTNPAQRAWARVPQRDVADGGPVLALVVADL